MPRRPKPSRLLAAAFSLGLAASAAAQAPAPEPADPARAAARDFRAALDAPDFTVGTYRYDCATGAVAFDGAPARDAADEAARRAAAFALIEKVSLDRVNPGGVAPATRELLSDFFETNAGAWFARKLLAEIAAAARDGELALADGACTGGATTPLHRALHGDLSYAGYFREGPPLFEILEHAGFGARAQPGLVSFGARGLRARFSGSGQRVDPLAIVAHEFGHTRFGDPTSGGSLAGERRTVADYENPVRRRNGFPPRRTYYSARLDQTIEVDSGRVSGGPPRR